MIKFASPQLKNSLAETMLEEELFERKKKELEKLKKGDKNTELIRPDFAKTANEVLQDVQYKGIVARAIGKRFEEREFINEKDLEKLMMLSELNPNFTKAVEVKLIPIMKKGKKWEDKESRKLRKHYIKKSHELFDILSKFKFEGILKSEEIFLNSGNIYDKTSAYLDFASAVALVNKGVRKRNYTKVSCSIYFREIYLSGTRGVIFGLFDGFDERGMEYLPSSIAVNSFREFSKGLVKEAELLPMLEQFARNADARISENVKGFTGTSATLGVVLGKKLYYINVGNNHIYGVDALGKVEKIVGDELVGFGNIEQLHSELKYPYLYLGGFTQRMKGKKSFRIIHTDFKLKAPYIGSMNISRFANIFVVNSGVWKSALSFENGNVRFEEQKFSEVLSKARNPLNAVERMNMQVKNAMKSAPDKSIVDDIGMLYFSV